MTVEKEKPHEFKQLVIESFQEEHVCHQNSLF